MRQQCREEREKRKSQRVSRGLAEGQQKQDQSEAAGCEAMQPKKVRLQREARGSESVKNASDWEHFGTWAVQTVHAAVARRAFWIQNVYNIAGSEHFWKIRPSKSAATMQITSRSQNSKNIRRSDHFWELRCWKSVAHSTLSSQKC